MADALVATAIPQVAAAKTMILLVIGPPVDDNDDSKRLL
jgi:hypothetical protein